MKLVEPPSCRSPSAIVFIGRNSRGHWVAQQQSGLYGGLFVNRAQAVKYALFENGHHPETIVELSREINSTSAADWNKQRDPMIGAPAVWLSGYIAGLPTPSRLRVPDAVQRFFSGAPQSRDPSFLVAGPRLSSAALRAALRPERGISHASSACIDRG